MLQQQDLGLFIKKYGISKPIAISIISCAIAAFITGVFILLSATTVKGCIIGAVTAFIGFVAFIRFIYFSQYTTVHLYEYGLSIYHIKHKITCSFSQIQDILDHMDNHNGISMGLSFRISNNSPWYYISYQTPQYYRLRNEIFKRHIEQRGSILFEHLKKGGTVCFHKISNGIDCTKSIEINDKFNLLSMEEIRLSKDVLIAGNIYIPIANIGNIYESTMLTNQAKIVDKNNQTLYTTYITSILSAPLLYALLIQLQNAVSTEFQKPNRIFSPVQQYNRYINKNTNKLHASL